MWEMWTGEVRKAQEDVEPVLAPCPCGTMNIPAQPLGIFTNVTAWRGKQSSSEGQRQGVTAPKSCPGQTEVTAGAG